MQKFFYLLLHRTLSIYLRLFLEWIYQKWNYWPKVKNCFRALECTARCIALQKGCTNSYHYRLWFEIIYLLLWKWVKKASIKMQPGSPGGWALRHRLLLGACITSRKKEEGIGILFPAFKKKRSPLPQQQCTDHHCGQWETTMTPNSCSSPVNFSLKQPSPVSS